MDGSAIDHSDSDSGDSWTLLDNNTNYADSPDLPDRPTASSTPENLDKDDDTDGISIITDSDPESSSPSQNNYEHISQEYSTLEQSLPQFIPENAPEIPIHLSDNSEKEEDDLLGDANAKHKTYVHRRNKRLSTVLNIIMLGSVITAAGVAIGHMWGAKTDCSMHPTTNINKILSNLYKLQEENAYLRAKLKELTIFNIQTNQKTVPKHNRCKKTYEEPLMSDNGKVDDRFTKCVDNTGATDKKILKSHMVEAISEDRILIGGKIPSQEGKKWVLEQKDKFLKNIQQHADKDSNNYDGHMRKKYKNDEYLNETKGLRYNRKSYADSLKYYEKDKDINKEPFISEVPENNSNKVNTNEREKSNKLNAKAPNNKGSYLRGEIGANELLHNNKNPNFHLNKRKDDFVSNDFSIYDKHENTNNKDNNKTIKIKTNYDAIKMTKNEYITKDDVLKFKKDKLDRKKLYKNLKDNREFDPSKPQKFRYVTEEELDAIVKENIKAKENKKQAENENDFTAENKNLNNQTPKSGIDVNNEEYFGNFKEKKMKRKREADSEEDLLKDDRYTVLKKKQERKKHDRQQSHKKVKRKNKYEQWEMKGGILRDFDDFSETSSKDYSNELNDMDIENNVFDNKVDKSVGTDNMNDKYMGRSSDMQNTKGDNELNEKHWLDERALFRKQARKRLEQEMFGNNISNTAGWYFRRMRKREHDREKSDNTYKKVLKRNMNYKMKY